MTENELKLLQSKLPVSESVLRLNRGLTADDIRAGVAKGIRADDRADQNRSARESAELEPTSRDASPPPVRTEEARSARYLVRFTDYRFRLLDEDNSCAKFHCDALRYCGLLPSDAPNRCKIEV